MRIAVQPVMSHRLLSSIYLHRILSTIVKRIFSALLVFSFALSATAGLATAEETSFNHVRMPNNKGKEIKSVLTFSDNDKAVEVRPKKGQAVSIPYSQIDKCSYEYTESLTPILKTSKTHWLKIDYHDKNPNQVLVLRMSGGNYTRILDALKAHAGIDAELFGNANKRRGDFWAKH
jgi:hypothetical protein